MNGLSLTLDFISAEEEQYILSNIDDKNKIVSKGRSVQEYGSKIYPEGVENEIPIWLDFLLDRLISAKTKRARHVSITHYQNGGYITPHVDKPASGNQIIVLSLISSAEIVFTQNELRETIILPPRSLLILQDEARWNWFHSIPKTEERVSITFRD